MRLDEASEWVCKQVASKTSATRPGGLDIRTAQKDGQWFVDVLRIEIWSKASAYSRKKESARLTQPDGDPVTRVRKRKANTIRRGVSKHSRPNRYGGRINCVGGLHLAFRLLVAAGDAERFEGREGRNKGQDFVRCSFWLDQF